MTTVPLTQMSTSSWLLGPSASHGVDAPLKVPDPSTVTDPFATNETALVMTSCSSYVPAHTLITCPDRAALSASLIVVNPGLAQLVSVPTVADPLTQRGGGGVAGAASTDVVAKKLAITA